MEIKHEKGGRIIAIRLEIREWGVAGGQQVIRFNNRLKELIPEELRTYYENLETWWVPAEYEDKIRELAKECFSPEQGDIFNG